MGVMRYHGLLNRKNSMKNKRIAFALMICVLLCLFNACSTSKQADQPNEMVAYRRGIYFDKDWDSQILTYDGDAVPDEECALAIAIAIYEALPKGGIEGLVPAEVFFDEEDNVWIVSFGTPPQTNGVYVLGGGLTIALQKKDGKVLRIRLEE